MPIVGANAASGSVTMIIHSCLAVAAQLAEGRGCACQAHIRRADTELVLPSLERNGRTLPYTSAISAIAQPVPRQRMVAAYQDMLLLRLCIYYCQHLLEIKE